LSNYAVQEEVINKSYAKKLATLLLNLSAKGYRKNISNFSIGKFKGYI